MLKTIKSTVKRALAQPRSPMPQSDPASQKSLWLMYQQAVASNVSIRAQDTGFKVYSQTDEDGILLYLLSVIGFKTRLSVEICASDGQECNTANLIKNHGFHGLLVDGDRASVARGRRHYATHAATYVAPPAFVHAWITRANVNHIIESNGFRGSIDVLSLDLDGVDYWIWEAIDVVTPRIVVLEYNDILGPDLSLTVPYSDSFSRHSPTGSLDFVGASLKAFVKLAQRKGYRLVATNTLGFNAFFVQDEIPERALPSLAVDQCFTHPKVLEGMTNRFPRVKDRPWVEV